MLFNTHSHINDKTENIEEILKECKELNVQNIVAVGYDFSSSIRAIELAKEHEMIYAACGLQPEEILKNQNSLQEFKNLIDNPNCVAIGEIGLDYYYGKENKENQLKWFEDFLKLACNYKKYHGSLDGIIMHCYTGSVEMMKQYLSLGAYISLSGVVTFKNAKTIKEVAIECPLDRLLIETDDPYLTPVPFRGKENKPAYVAYVAQEIALLKGMDVMQIQKATFENAKKVFHL